MTRALLHTACPACPSGQVATFLAVRFPILLALNKADLPSAAAHISRVRQQMPHECIVAVSAASERWLAGAVRAGQVDYQVMPALSASIIWHTPGDPHSIRTRDQQSLSTLAGRQLLSLCL